MPDTTLKVEGLREFQRDLHALSKDADKEFKREMKATADPVAQDARRMAARYGPKVVRGIRPGTRQGGAVVRGGRRTTGQRPNFGRIQIALLSRALEQNADRAVREAAEVFERFARKHGFH